MAIYIPSSPGEIDYEIGNDDIPPEIDNNNRQECLKALARLFEEGSGKEPTSGAALDTPRRTSARFRRSSR